jgi:hypothetical protein
VYGQNCKFVLERSACLVQFDAAMAHALLDSRSLVPPWLSTERVRLAVCLAGGALVAALRQPWRRVVRVSVSAVSGRWLQQHDLAVGKRGEPL